MNSKHNFLRNFAVIDLFNPKSCTVHNALINLDLDLNDLIPSLLIVNGLRFYHKPLNIYIYLKKNHGKIGCVEFIWKIILINSQ